MRIGIIGAMDEEIENYKPRIKGIQQSSFANISFYQGKLGENQVVLCKSGVGKVNSAVCTQILIDKFQIEKLIFTGVAGALHPELDIGDIVISTKAQQYDIDASPLGFEKGIIPFSKKSIFEADEELVNLAAKASKEVSNSRVFTGKILSGDKFIADVETAKELYNTFDGLCTEMEGAAVAQVCDMNEIPFVIVRSMSDKADHSAEVNFLEFAKFAADRSCLIVDRMLTMSNVNSYE
ncbi:MAG: 5'-methylthioadenosine/adenosylhomocysteine nucleosidase [Vulcanibacillus sp.]